MGETAYNEDQQKKALALIEPDYFPKKSEAELLDYEKNILQKRLNEITAEQNKNRPEIEKQKKIRLHHAVQQHKKEKQIQNEIIQKNFEQETIKTPSGAIGWGY